MKNVRKFAKKKGKINNNKRNKWKKKGKGETKGSKKPIKRK